MANERKKIIDPRQLDFLNFTEASQELEKIAEENGCDSVAELIDNDLGKGTYKKHPRKAADSRRELKRHIQQNQGDAGFYLYAKFRDEANKQV